MLATPPPAAHTNGLWLNVLGWTVTGLMACAAGLFLVLTPA
jgi:hypothetical protein